MQIKRERNVSSDKIYLKTRTNQFFSEVHCIFPDDNDAPDICAKTD